MRKQTDQEKANQINKAIYHLRNAQRQVELAIRNLANAPVRAARAGANHEAHTAMDALREAQELAEIELLDLGFGR